MIIRKKFTFAGMHIVRNCSSIRCKQSIHSHSYEVEVFLTSQGLDNGLMVYDFGLMKGTIKDFINSFNNSYSMWNKESDEFKTFIKSRFERVISMPVSPSAEAYSLMFLFVIDKMLNATEFNNGEKSVTVSSVRVHETATGYAESFRNDLVWFDFGLEDIVFNHDIEREWKDPNMYSKLCKYTKNPTRKKPFRNNPVKQQV